MARIKSKAAMWRRMVRGHARSGMSIRAYCARHDVKEPAFYWWRRELARRDAGKPRSRVAAFVPVVVEAAPDRVESVTIELRGGRTLRLPSIPVEQVVELIRALEGDVKAGAS
jgi:transposase-like protein